MNWDDLKLFLEVCRRSRLEEAAVHVDVDPTTLSRRIKRLEKALGDTLFERTRRGHRLTPAGERLAAQAEKMESVSLDILSGSAGEQMLSGRVRLGAPEGVGTKVIAPALASFKIENPLIDIDLIALSGFVSVPKRQADMSILLARPTTGRLRVRRLADYCLYLYASKTYLRHSPLIVSTESLSRHVLIGYTEDLIYSSQLRYLEDVLPGLSPSLCSPSIIAQTEMALAGAGVGILPAFIAEQYPSLQRVLPEEVVVERTFWLAIHEDVVGIARNRVVIEFLTRLEF